MKLLTNKDLVGKSFWVQYQSLRGRNWNVEAKRYCTFGDDSQEKEKKDWPTIPTIWVEMARILRGWNYELERHGHSKRESENHYLVRKKNYVPQVVTAPWLIIGQLTVDQKEALGLKNATAGSYIVEMEQEYTGQVINGADIEEVSVIIGDARVEWLQTKKKRFLQEFIKASLDGIIAIIDSDRKDFMNDVPEDFLVLARFSVIGKNDRYSNVANVFRHVILNKDLPQVQGNIVHISVPDDYKPHIIGKNWDNIHAAEKKIGREIRLI